MCHILQRGAIFFEKTVGFSFWAGKGRIFEEKKSGGFKNFSLPFSNIKPPVAPGVIFSALF